MILERHDMANTKVARIYGSLVEHLSFSGELYKLRRDLNARIDQPESIEEEPRSHPLGVARWFKKRRISIAEAYLMVIKDLDSRHSKSRLRALRIMVDASFHTQALDMPLNTARVQMALIKEAVKSRDDRRRQLELLQDFSRSSYGQAQAVRRLLDRMGLIELPETGKKLKELGLGADRHVHDTATSGRKNPTQLLIDAFIKGISEITIAYNGASAMEMMEEAVESGRIVGIRVNVGIEVGLDFEGERFHFMALLPETRRGEDVRRFFAENRKTLKPLLSGLEEDQEGRVEAIRHLLAAFNGGPLAELNEGFPARRAYRIPRLRMKKLAAFVPLASASRAHLGEFLWQYYKPAMFNRVLYLKAQRGRAIRDRRGGLISDWDLGIIEARYAKAREEFRTMSPDGLRKRYFPDPAEADHASAFDDLGRLRKTLSQAGCRLKLIQPLEHGLSRAARLLEAGRGIIDEVEVYNIQDSVRRDPEEIARFCRLVNEHNAKSAREGGAPYLPVCGSDANGRSPDIPGMGFIRSSALAGKYGKRYEKRHIRLPVAASRMILSGGAAVDLDSVRDDEVILCMGKVSEGYENRLGDEEDSGEGAIPLGRALRYLNPTLVGFFISGIGFLVAYRFIGAGYACLWLGITGFRNSIADLFAFRGTRIRQWSLKNVNWNNVAQSLFWTGFSVPIMSFIKAKFDILWPLAGLATTGLFYTAAKFFFVAFANGLYIASHNKLRGFDKKVIRANLFRTIISWPFATAFAPVGNAIGIPTIVQSKIWSDVVAGFIEGSGKYFKTLRLRRRDVEEIVPRIVEGKKEERAIAALDLLYLFREEPRTKNSLRTTLKPQAAGLFGKRPAPDAEAEATQKLAALLAVFSDEGLDQLLIDYALTRHVKEMAVDLIRLISETLPEFRDWLGALARGRPWIDSARRRVRRGTERLRPEAPPGRPAQTEPPEPSSAASTGKARGKKAVEGEAAEA
jgi:hypothetical protein